MLHDLLKELREDKGLNQNDLADILNVTRQTISGYETGSIEPPFSTLIKLADIYNCSLDYLAGRTKERYNYNLFEKDKRIFLKEFIKTLDSFEVKKKK